MCLLAHFLGFAKAVIKFEHLLYHEQNPVSITCSNSTVETPKHYEICSKIQKGKQKDVNDVFLVSLMLTLNIFHTFRVSMVDFEKGNAGWECFKLEVVLSISHIFMK